MPLESNRMTSASENPLWDFSLAVYGRPGVADACLALQDRLGLDVNLLLFCCWAGCCGHRLTAGDLAGLRAVADPWQERVVRPLRAVRRAVAPRPSEAAFHQNLKALELEAERLAQDKLHRALPLVAPTACPRPEAVADNLRSYLRCRQVEFDVAGLADLAALMIGCCNGLPGLEAMRRLQQEDCLQTEPA